jgi:hypothetical protein
MYLDSDIKCEAISPVARLASRMICRDQNDGAPATIMQHLEKARTAPFRDGNEAAPDVALRKTEGDVHA